MNFAYPGAASVPFAAPGEVELLELRRRPPLKERFAALRVTAPDQPQFHSLSTPVGVTKKSVPNEFGPEPRLFGPYFLSLSARVFHLSGQG
jgi:hypothetical protein